jgi:hypothetical protein
MKKFLQSLALGILVLPWIGAASAQQANNYWCNSATVPCPPSGWTPSSVVNPFPVIIYSGGGAGAGSQPYNYTPLTPDQHNLAITTSTALTIPTGALQAVVCASGNNVNYTYDGTTTPTSSVGMPLKNGQCVALSGATLLANFRAIQTAATATLDVAYTK